MKVVINRCFGGFGLSPHALKRIAELQGREIYFFTMNYSTKGDRSEYIPFNIDKDRPSMLISAFDIPNPNEVLASTKDWYKMSMDEKKLANQLHADHYIGDSQFSRDDPLLVQVVEELGEKSWGHCAELAIVEVPDDVVWTIEDYDGNEHIAEAHRTWG